MHERRISLSAPLYFRAQLGFGFFAMERGSAQLTVFAAATVVAAESTRLFVFGFLTGDAQAHTGNGFATRLGNLGATLLAMSQPRTAGQLLFCTLDRVLNGCVDLILHGSIAGPTRRHLIAPEPTYQGNAPVS
jgi:hypothetical protein